MFVFLLNFVSKKSSELLLFSMRFYRGLLLRRFWRSAARLPVDRTCLLSEGIDEAVDSRELLFVHRVFDLFGNIPGVSLSAKSIFEFGVIGIVGAADAPFAEVV